MKLTRRESAANLKIEKNKDWVDFAAVDIETKEIQGEGQPPP